MPQARRGVGRRKKCCSRICGRRANTASRLQARPMVECEWCSTPFAKDYGQRYCSHACGDKGRTDRNQRPDRFPNCTICGKVFVTKATRQACCSVDCQSALCAQKAKNRAVVYECKQRHDLFRKSRSGRLKGDYCSRECYFLKIKTAAACRARFTKIWTPTCLECKRVFISKRGEAMDCGATSCRNAIARRHYHENKILVPKVDAYSDCIECGREFSYTLGTRGHSGQRLFCSLRCTKKDAKRRRREALRGTVDLAIRPRFSSVFSRDKGCCGICGLKTDRAKAVPHPLAPTLDHVLPVSKGGRHEMDNVRIAHFSCNSKRGNRDVTEGLIDTCRVAVLAVIRDSAVAA